MPGEGRRHGDITAWGGEAGGAFARDIRRGHRRRRRRVLGRIPLLGDRQWAAGRTRGPVVLPPIGGGGGGDEDEDEGEGEECSTRRPAVLDLGQRPGASKCGTRTGLLFAPAVYYLSGRR